MTKTTSFLRIEEYKRLSKVSLTGRVLDIGGSQKSGYHELLKGSHEITTANIDAEYGADLIFDAEATWPIEDSSYDAILFINVLEHLYQPQRAMGEASRALVPGGRIIGVVPFMFNVHASPNDFFRYTKSALERMLADSGFSQIQVEELGTGAFSVVYHAVFAVIRWRWLAAILRGACRGLDTFLARMKPGNRMSAEYMPLGYYFEAVKTD